MAMDPELKAKWVAALRSGDFTQTRYYLKITSAVAKKRAEKYDEDAFPVGHCCLGVLCEIDDRPHTKELAQGQVLTNYSMNQFGLDEDTMNALAELNDSGESFSAIADHIESHGEI